VELFHGGRAGAGINFARTTYLSAKPKQLVARLNKEAEPARLVENAKKGKAHAAGIRILFSAFALGNHRTGICLSGKRSYDYGLP
jgi:hypothetical protein